MEIYQFNPQEMLAFVLVLLRISACFVVWPLFGSAQIPGVAKVLTSLMLTIVLFPVVGWKTLGLGIDTGLLPYLAVKEAFVGVIIGLTVRLSWAAISILGDIVSVSTGISADQLFNPTLSQRSTVIDQYYIMVATVLLLAMNGHYLFFTGLVESFQIIPLSAGGLNLSGFLPATDLAQMLMVSGLKLAAPIFASLFIMNMTLGVLSRAAPQMNILVTSLTVNMALGLIVMIVSLPLMGQVLQGLMGQTGDMILAILKSVKGT